MQLLDMFQGWIDFVPEHFLDYEYEPAVQALGWILELYPIAVTILIGAWNVWRLRSEGEDVRFLQVPTQVNLELTTVLYKSPRGRYNK